MGGIVMTICTDLGVADRLGGKINFRQHQTNRPNLASLSIIFILKIRIGSRRVACCNTLRVLRLRYLEFIHILCLQKFSARLVEMRTVSSSMPLQVTISTKYFSAIV